MITGAKMSTVVVVVVVVVVVDGSYNDGRGCGSGGVMVVLMMVEFVAVV
jgi:hypothetical protein